MWRMNENNRVGRSVSEPLQAEVRPKRGISLVWLIPLVALAIGGFLAWKAYSERGPTITITFDTAEGLEAGKTKLRYLDVEVGTVQSVAIAPGLKNIVVTAEMVPSAAEYLRAHPEPSERLFNEMGYGSYLIWALYPDVRVFIDARVELYPIEQWQDYIAIGQARDYNALLIDKYGVTRVMLDRKLQPTLSEALGRDRLRWTLEYRDAQTEIYRRSER